ncbi:MAG: diadenylate cyclase CdaA [Lachnospiraceae bacterium]|nr:diadenylate cyclase CdaA [Lachnospiraceae bacterium]
MGQWLSALLDNILGDWYIPDIGIIDILEVIIITLIVYRIVIWIKNTKAWMLLKGLLVLSVFILIAAILQMHTILFLAQASLSILAFAAVIVFQPELRRALEKIGEKDFISRINPFDSKSENLRFHDDTMRAIVNAAGVMSGQRTGALIIVEQATRLSEYEMTGIEMDCVVSEQILLNIFENNTPLHDGAVILRGDRVASATCYLPLSDNMHLSKDLGTRHRAALGITEVSDAMAIVLSEETGAISVAVHGRLVRRISIEELTQQLEQIQMKSHEGRKFRFGKRRKRF